MNIEYLHEFVVLAYHLNFSAAAKELHMSQPTLSGHIAAIEDEIGATLFDRDKQHVSLTPAGKTCLQDANEVISSYNSLLRHARQLSASRSSKIVVQTYADHRYLADIVHAVGQSPPIAEAAIEVELKDLPRIDLFSDVRERRVDLLLLLETFDELPKDLTMERLSDEPLAAIVPSSSPLAEAPTLSVHALDGKKISVPGMPDNHWFASNLSRALETMGISAEINELYYGHVSDLYRQIGKNDIYVDSFTASYTMPLTMSQSHKILRFDEDAMAIQRVVIYREDNDKTQLGAVIAELKRLMDGTSETAQPAQPK